MDRVLFVTCHEAENLKNTDGMFGKSDPYWIMGSFNGGAAHWKREPVE